jgi:hypothetical protein
MRIFLLKKMSLSIKNRYKMLLDALERINKEKLSIIVSWTTIIASICTLIMLIISMLTLKETINQFQVSNSNTLKEIELVQKQLEYNWTFSALQLPASLVYSPKYDVQIKNDTFHIDIINTNTYPIVNVRYLTNLFKASTQIRLSGLATIPIMLKDTILPFEKTTVKIPSSYIKNGLGVIEDNGKSISLINIQVFYTRSIDKREFIGCKVYICSSNSLTDMEANVDFYENRLPYLEIKKQLCASADL